MTTTLAPCEALLNVHGLAKLLGISAATVYRYRSEGMNEFLPPTIMVGSQPRWRPETVEKWMTEQERKSTDAA